MSCIRRRQLEASFLVDFEHAGGAATAIAELEFGAFKADSAGQVAELGRVADDLGIRILIADIAAEAQCLVDRVIFRVIRAGQAFTAPQQYAARHRHLRLVADLRLQLTDLELDDVRIARSETFQQRIPLGAGQWRHDAAGIVLRAGKVKRQQQDEAGGKR